MSTIDTMRPIDQKLAIAKLEGWRDLTFRGIWDPKDEDYIGKIRHGWSDPVPAYLSDHETMRAVILKHVAGKPDLEDSFVLILTAICSNHSGSREDDLFAMSTATTPQLAEAFVKTMGLWKVPVAA